MIILKTSILLNYFIIWDYKLLYLLTIKHSSIILQLNKIIVTYIDVKRICSDNSRWLEKKYYFQIFLLIQIQAID